MVPGAKPPATACHAGAPPLPCITMAPAPDTGAASAIELSDQQLADYRSDGFVVVEDLVSAAELRALQQVLGAVAAPAGAVHVAAAASVARHTSHLTARDGAAGHAQLRCRSPGPRRRSRLRARRSLPTEAPRPQGPNASASTSRNSSGSPPVFAAEVASPRRLRCRSVRAVSGFVSGLRRRLSRYFRRRRSGAGLLLRCRSGAASRGRLRLRRRSCSAAPHRGRSVPDSAATRPERRPVPTRCRRATVAGARRTLPSGRRAAKPAPPDGNRRPVGGHAGEMPLQHPSRSAAKHRPARTCGRPNYRTVPAVRPLQPA